MLIWWSQWWSPLIIWFKTKVSVLPFGTVRHYIMDVDIVCSTRFTVSRKYQYTVISFRFASGWIKIPQYTSRRQIHIKRVFFLVVYPASFYDTVIHTAVFLTTLFTMFYYPWNRHIYHPNLTLISRAPNISSVTVSPSFNSIALAIWLGISTNLLPPDALIFDWIVNASIHITYTSIVYMYYAKVGKGLQQNPKSPITSLHFLNLCPTLQYGWVGSVERVLR